MAAPKPAEIAPEANQTPSTSSKDIEVEIALSNVQKHLAKDDLASATKLSRAIVAKHPNSVKAWSAFGTLLFRLGKNKEAGQAFSKVVNLNPNDASAYNNLGNAHAILKDSNKAITCYQRAIALRPDFAQCYSNFGRVLAQKGKLKEAAVAFQKAIQLKDSTTQTLLNLADVLMRLNLSAQAAPLYQQAIERNPKDAGSLAKLGAIRLRLGQTEEAIDLLKQVHELAPNNVSIETSLGNALTSLRRFDEALIHHQNAVKLAPDNATAHLNLAVVYKELGLMDEVIASSTKSLELNPNNIAAETGLGVAHLSLGNFEQGWEYYEARRKHPMRKFNVVDESKEWKGEDLAGKKLLVCSEQGFGDRIQFIRFLRHPRFEKADVHLLIQPNLFRLIEPFTKGTNVTLIKETGQNVYDYEAYLMGLCRILKVGSKDFKTETPYLHAEDALIEKWKDRIGEKGFKVGIAWQGKPSTEVDQGRSVPVSNFQALSAIDGVRLISLQKEHGVDQLESLPKGMEVEILKDFDTGSDAFIDSAAIISNLDLVVTTDMAIAHLAGALGVPVWVALKRVPDWRWGLKGTKTPWYPTMKLFRQRKDGNWKPVFKRIASGIESLLSE